MDYNNPHFHNNKALIDPILFGFKNGALARQLKHSTSTVTKEALQPHLNLQKNKINEVLFVMTN